MHHPTDRITYTSAFVMPVVEHWLEREIAQWVHHEGSISLTMTTTTLLIHASTTTTTAATTATTTVTITTETVKEIEIERDGSQRGGGVRV